MDYLEWNHGLLRIKGVQKRSRDVKQRKTTLKVFQRGWAFGSVERDSEVLSSNPDTTKKETTPKTPPLPQNSLNKTSTCEIILLMSNIYMCLYKIYLHAKYCQEVANGIIPG